MTQRRYSAVKLVLRDCNEYFMRDPSDKTGVVDKVADGSFGARWSGRLALLCMGSVLALGLGEGVVRVVRPAAAIRPICLSDDESAYKRSDNPVLSYELKANYRNPNPDGNFSCAHTNAFGQHDIERSVAKRPGVRRIILLGDSVVEGLGIADFNDLMNIQMERLASNPTTEVLNFGVEGYCNRSEVELLRVKGLQFNPDQVIMVFVENDFEDFNQSASNSQVVLNRPWIINTLFTHSHLVRHAFVNWNAFGFGVDQEPVHFSAQAIGRNNVVTGLNELCRLARENHFQPLIAVWPTFRDSDIIDRPTMPDSKELVIERLSRHFGIPCVRLSEWFRKQAYEHGIKNPRMSYTVGDGMHANVLGNRVAAAALLFAVDRAPEWLELLETAPVTSVPDLQAINLTNEHTISLSPPAEFYADDYCEKGEWFLERRRVDRAAAFYLGALKLDSGSVRALQGLALARLWQRDIQDAVFYCDKVLRLEPQNPQAILLRAVTLEIQEKGDFSIGNEGELFGWRSSTTGVYMSFEELVEINRIAKAGVSPIGQFSHVTKRSITAIQVQSSTEFSKALQKAMAKHGNK